MSYTEKARAIMRNWNKEDFIKIHHPHYMFIRETEPVSLDEWANKMEKWVTSGDFTQETLERVKTSLVHENEHVSELRWEEEGDLVTHVVLKTKGLAWRSIVNRVPLEDLEEVFI
tara:strand:- start:403 stop:747 length:345 start_codon:yes stop_codon:yes gene_type:complete